MTAGTLPQVDSKLSACLMMSNLAPELKQHAVTLYEVGKIPNESLDAFLAATESVQVRRDRPLHSISARLTDDGGHFCSAPPWRTLASSVRCSSTLTTQSRCATRCSSSADRR